MAVPFPSASAWNTPVTDRLRALCCCRRWGA